MACLTGWLAVYGRTSAEAAIRVDENDIIGRHFLALGPRRADVVLGIGDDAAVLKPPAGMDLISTTDSLVEGTHFLPGTDPRSLGYRALAVNLSDCAAMGARPLWALLSLVMPSADDAWLGAFAGGLGELLSAHEVALVGGNLARGPLSITVQLMGSVARGRALRRDSARAGDLLFVTGTLGDAAAGLAVLQRRLRVPDAAPLLQRFGFPEPRVALGLRLHGIASAAMDISDGLAADLPRLLVASGLSATVDVEALPLSPALRAAFGAEAWRLAVSGGEDYELLIAAPPVQRAALLAAAWATHTSLAEIGVLAAADAVPAGERLRWRQRHDLIRLGTTGFDHFGS
jgi:thiamine-monophosphate kinase